MMALAVWVCKQSIERNNRKMLTQRETWKEYEIQKQRDRNKDTYHGISCLGCPWDKIMVRNHSKLIIKRQKIDRK
jgi:hypothetical protein